MYFIRKKRLNLLLFTFLVILSISIYAATTGTVYIISPGGSTVATNTCSGDFFSCSTSYHYCGEEGAYHALFDADGGSVMLWPYAYYCDCAAGSKQCSGTWVQTCTSGGSWSNTQNCDNSDCTTGIACSGVGTSTISETGNDYSCSGGSCPVTSTKTCNGPWVCGPGTSGSSQACAGTSYVCFRSNAGAWTWATSAEVTETNCDDGFDNDLDGSTDCQDSDCNGRIEGNVEDQDNGPLGSATVKAFQSSTVISQGSTDLNGDYGFDIACGTYNLAASKTDYIPDSETGVVVPPRTTIQNIDFTLTYGIVCEADCSYLIDTRCHQECHGVKGCSFYDPTAMSNCDKSQMGWEVDYDASNIVECCTGSPTEKTEQKAEAYCPFGNLVKSYRLLYRQGKPIRMVTVVCGD